LIPGEGRILKSKKPRPQIQGDTGRKGRVVRGAQSLSAPQRERKKSRGEGGGQPSIETKRAKERVGNVSGN